jgi:hypothetical protein
LTAGQEKQLCEAKAGHERLTSYNFIWNFIAVAKGSVKFEPNNNQISRMLGTEDYFLES